MSGRWSELDTRKKLMSKLIAATIDGRLELYGKLITDSGVFRFRSKIPADHMRTHGIDTFSATNKLKNELVYTYESALGDPLGGPFRSGCYCDLYVSRDVKRLLMMDDK